MSEEFDLLTDGRSAFGRLERKQHEEYMDD